MLNNTFSYWEQTSFLSGYDVLIVGSGIVGLTAAIELKVKRPDLNVAILERGFLPSGASTKNAGFACFGSISEGLDELHHISEDEFLQVVEKRWRGLQRLRTLIGDAQMDYQQNGGYELFLDTDNPASELVKSNIERFNKLLRQIISRYDIYSVANEKIAEFSLSGVSLLIENKMEGQIDTGKMMNVLVQKAQAMGVLIFNNCEVVGIEHSLKKIGVKTSQGKILSKKVLFCNNAFIKHLYTELDVVPGRGQVLITKEIPGLKIKGTFHYDKGYYYFRNINNRILIGGGRNKDFKGEETFDFGRSDEIQGSIEELLYKVVYPFSPKPEIEYRWSGIMGFGESIAPIIRNLEPGTFCAVRCNGMGIAQGSLNGQAAAELVISDLDK